MQHMGWENIVSIGSCNLLPSCFMRSLNAKRLAGVFFVVSCMCWSCSLPVYRHSVPESGEPLLHAFVELFEDANQATRMEAYFLSVGLPNMPKLEQILRQRQNTSDQLERIITSYALAAMTRDHQDIDAFLDVFPNEPQLFTDIMEAEWTLSGTFNAGMADFLLLLAYEPRTREKALPHLAHIIRNMPRELESMRTYFEDPLVRTYIDRHWADAGLDNTLYHDDRVRIFEKTDKCEEKLILLIQHGDVASKITAMLMSRRIWISDNLLEIIRNFQELPHDFIYRYLLTFDDDIESFSNLLLAHSKDTLSCLLAAEKKLYHPPLKGIVGRLWLRLSFDDKNRRSILKILREIQQYGRTWLEVCDVYRLMTL